MVRSILLRGFDQQCAEIIGDYMKNHKVKFLRGAVPSKVWLSFDAMFAMIVIIIIN